MARVKLHVLGIIIATLWLHITPHNSHITHHTLYTSKHHASHTTPEAPHTPSKCSLTHPQALERLLKAGRRPDTDEEEDEQGLTALHAAALAGHVRCAELLLAYSANAATCASDGRTPASMVPESVTQLKLAGSTSTATEKQLGELRRRLETAAAKQKPKKAGKAANAQAAAGSGKAGDEKGAGEGGKAKVAVGHVVGAAFSGLPADEQARKVRCRLRA